MRNRDSFFMPSLLSFPLAALAAVSSYAGAFVAGTYARETPNWAAQAIGGDTVNLFVFVPALVISAAATLRGSRRFALLLGGALLYSAYLFVTFGFAVHFGPWFLVYCAELGLTFYALTGLLVAFHDADVRTWFSGRAPVRVAGSFLVLLALVFYWLWLSEDVPALVAGTVPKSLVDAGLLTNPVHVIDLGIVLPALLGAAIALVRGRSFGYYLAPIALGFIVLQSAAIAGMVAELARLDPASDISAVWFLGAMALLAAAVLWAFLRCVREERLTAPAPPAMMQGS